MFDAVKKFPLL